MNQDVRVNILIFTKINKIIANTKLHYTKLIFLFILRDCLRREGTCVSQYLLTGSYARFCNVRRVRCSLQCPLLRPLSVRYVFCCAFVSVPTAPLASAEAAMTTAPIKQRPLTAAAPTYPLLPPSELCLRIRARPPSLYLTLQSLYSWLRHYSKFPQKFGSYKFNVNPRGYIRAN